MIFSDHNDGLIAYYPLDGNTTNVLPISNNIQQNFVVYGATPTSDFHNREDHAYYFDGTSYLVTQTSDFLPDKDRTISFWFNTNDVSGGSYVLGYGGNECGQSYFHALRWEAPPNSYDIQSHCVINRICYIWNDTTNPTNHGWTMWTLTSNLTHGSYMYLNNTLIVSDPANIFDDTIISNSYLVFGAGISANGQMYPYSDYSGNLYRGKLDELRIYNRSLSYSEIISLFDDFVTLPTSMPSNNPSQTPTTISNNPSNNPSQSPTVSTNMSSNNPSQILTTKSTGNINNDSLKHDESGVWVWILVVLLILVGLLIVIVGIYCKRNSVEMDEKNVETIKVTIRNDNFGTAGMETKEYEEKENEYNNIAPSAPLEANMCDINENTLNETCDNNGGEGLVAPGVDREYHKIKEWFLKCVKLNANDEYCNLFIENGFEKMDIIKSMSNEDLIEIGIAKLGHRKQILSAIDNL